MTERFSRNKLMVKDIYSKFDNKEWIIDSTYQRRRVWIQKDNVRLIETVLLGLVIPEIFIWDAETNPDSGYTITHIVDGQQRISAIFDFISDEFELSGKYLIDENIRAQFAEKKFSDLPPDTKRDIWRYEMSIVNLDNNFSKFDIQNMFYRLNLTDYSLNDQEKRNSIDSAFGRAAERLADNSFWDEQKIFSRRDIRRMGDVEYCSSILVLCREGIVDQTKQDKLDQIYQDYAEEYNDAERDIKKTLLAMNMIKNIVTLETATFSRKKTQMYTLFSLAFSFIDENIVIDDNKKDYYIHFVYAYDAFKNEYDLKLDNEEENKAYEMIKKYKLASSEGVNKLTNRMIRFEVLRKIILDLENISLEALQSVETKCMELSNAN